MDDPNKPPTRKLLVKIYCTYRGKKVGGFIRQSKFDNEQKSFDWAQGVIKEWNTSFPSMFDFHVVASKC